VRPGGGIHSLNKPRTKGERFGLETQDDRDGEEVPGVVKSFRIGFGKETQKTTRGAEEQIHQNLKFSWLQDSKGSRTERMKTKNPSPNVYDV